MPLFEAMESCDNNSSARGNEGPLQVHVKTDKEIHPVTGSFIEAAYHSNIPFNQDYNDKEQEGISYLQVTQKRGIRCSSSVAFLRPAMSRKNLTIETNATVHKVLIENNCAVGIRYEKNGLVKDVNAAKVIVSAGAINSPKLLMLSGIGDSKALTELGISPVVDRPAVGRNLLEHPLVRLVYQVSTPTYNTKPYSVSGFFRKAGFFLNYIFKGIGPLSIAFEAVAFLKTRMEEQMPDIQIHFMPIGLAVNTKKLTPLALPALSILINKNYPKSAGLITLASGDPMDAPLIHSRLLDDQEDVDTLVRGYQLVRNILEKQPIKRVLVEEIRPGKAIDTDLELEAYVRDHAELCFHFASTCRMGVDEEAVVTPDLQVRGVGNLWVADASIMPDLISGNTNAACMMIGEKLGRSLSGLS